MTKRQRTADIFAKAFSIASECPAATNGLKLIGTHDAAQDEWREAQLLYLQHFTGGEEGRRATVRIICPENRREEDGIVIVHEPKMKQYVITVRIAAICTPAAEPAAVKAPAPAPTPAAAAAGKEKPAPAPAARASPLAELSTPQARPSSPVRS